jgi:hypothetical protein
MVKSPGIDGSDIFKDGYLQLAASVVINAVYDLRSPDLFKALDALGWWLSDAEIWLDALGFEDDDCMFKALEAFNDNGKLSTA